MIDVEIDIYSESLAHKAFHNGGFTFDCNSGSYPESGYAVATFPNAEWIVPGAVLKASTIHRFITERRALLDQPHAHIGAWATTNAWGEPRWYLDVSTVIHDRDSAIALAKLHNQLAIYDLANHEEIRV
jgi:hypothetical protein